MMGINVPLSIVIGNFMPPNKGLQQSQVDQLRLSFQCSLQRAKTLQIGDLLDTYGGLNRLYYQWI